jgi:hypothetical protein
MMATLAVYDGNFGSLPMTATTAVCLCDGSLPDNRQYIVITCQHIVNTFTNPDLFSKRIAEKSAHKKLKQWSKKCSQEMGISTMTFYGYMRSDKKFVVDV